MPVDFTNAWKTGFRLVNEAVSLLPNLIIGTMIFILFLILGSATRAIARRLISKRTSHQALGLLLGRLLNTAIVVLGFLIALSVVAPSFQASDLIKLLGVGTVAVGFAFQNILQNFLAGILLLMQEPFQPGDLISVTGIEGSVADIQARATGVTTKEGRQVLIPNATIFTNPVAVDRNFTRLKVPLISR